MAHLTPMTEPADMTLDELRDALAPLLPAEAAFDGWTPVTLDAAAKALGVPTERARLVLDRPAAMIDAWFAYVDREMAVRLPPQTLAAMKIRERISALVLARIAIVAPHREALRRALAVLALPTNLPAATRLGWRAADAMWRLAGDRATGFAHYSKRLTLGGVYGATLLAFLDDGSEDLGETRAFLARRIDEVMRFETVKARWKPQPDRHFSVTRFLGRLRYPAH